VAFDIKQAIDNVKNIYMSDSSLDTLLNFERVLSELDLYVFANWKQGELVIGPEYEKYWVTCTFMWPYHMMPDPRGGERLLDYDCEVRYKKSKMTFPKTIEKPEDYKPGTKFNKSMESDIWLVEITMPKQLMTDIQQGSLELENEKVDMEDVESAYEAGEDEDAATGSTEVDGQEQGMSPQQGGMPQQPPGGMGGF